MTSLSFRSLFLALLLLVPVGADPSGLRLDNGKPWKVEPKMMIHLRAMETALQSTSVSPKETSKVLQGCLQSLVASCTMTGPAHDELHKWLVPFMETANALAESHSEKQQRKLLDRLRDSYQSFNVHFH